MVADEASVRDLESAYRAFALQALAFLQREKRAGQIRRSARVSYTFPREEQLSYDFAIDSSASDFQEALSRTCQSGGLASAFNTCLAQHSSTLLSKLSWYENASDPPPDIGVPHEEGERGALLRPIASAMAQHANRRVTIDHVMDEYQHAMKAWQSQGVHRHVIVPLLHFSGIAASLKLSGGITVAPLTRQEKERIVNNAFRRLVPGLPSPLDLQSLWIATHKIEFTYEKKVEPVSGQELLDSTASRIHPLIVALRLWKPGRVGTAGAVISSTGPFLHPSHTYYVPLATDTYASPVSQYHLVAQERQSFRRFYTKIESIVGERSGFLKSAIESFSRSYRDQSLEAAVVDLAVALESALVENNEEIAYKFRMRGGAVGTATKLTDLVFGPVATRDLLSVLYNARSKIVHEGARLEHVKLTTPDKTTYSAQAFLDHSQACTRSLLRRMVNYLSDTNDLEVRRIKQKWAQRLDEALLID